MVNLEEALVEAVQGSGIEVKNLDFEEERRDGKAEIAELINVLQAIMMMMILSHTMRIIYE